MTDENIKRWKCLWRKMLQADSTGRVGLKLIVRIGDFLMILAILFGKSHSHLSENLAS